MKRCIVGLVLLTVTFVSVTAGAQEILGLGGMMKDTATAADRSASWQLEYNEGLGDHSAYSISYLNEGHLPAHHRDGITSQLWTRTTLYGGRLSLAAGAGPFYYFDTVAAKTGDSYTNDHGWGANLSLAATWYTADRWLLQFRSNFIETVSGLDTVSALVGIGYQLEAPPAPGPRPFAVPQTEKTTNNELTVYVGQAIVNSFTSEHSVATAIEYRRGLLPFVDGSVSWIYEGDKRLTRRNGVSTQLWAVKDFFAEQLGIGIGAGAYFSVDNYHDNDGNQEKNSAVSGIITMTASYRFHPHWNLRTSWNRIVTNYSRDTDVVLGGVGYRF
jgi:hypothetical protein